MNGQELANASHFDSPPADDSGVEGRFTSLRQTGKDCTADCAKQGLINANIFSSKKREVLDWSVEGRFTSMRQTGNDCTASYATQTLSVTSTKSALAAIQKCQMYNGWDVSKDSKSP